MRQAQTLIRVATCGRNLYEFTKVVNQWLQAEAVSMGLLTLFCQHTSASLTIQENADPDVQHDLNLFFQKLVPDGASGYRHVMEGADDMPAHIKGTLTDVSLTIPVQAGRMTLGTWQGIYLFEHRSQPHQRHVVAHFLGV